MDPHSRGLRRPDGSFTRTLATQVDRHSRPGYGTFDGTHNGPMHKHGESTIKVHGERLRWLDLVMVPILENVDPLLSFSMHRASNVSLSYRRVREIDGSTQKSHGLR